MLNPRRSFNIRLLLVLGYLNRYDMVSTIKQMIGERRCVMRVLLQEEHEA
jgi:hypothetical protein